jgi:hypothetical protein
MDWRGYPSTKACHGKTRINQIKKLPWAVLSTGNDGPFAGGFPKHARISCQYVIPFVRLVGLLQVFSHDSFPIPGEKCAILLSFVTAIGWPPDHNFNPNMSAPNKTKRETLQMRFCCSRASSEWHVPAAIS